MTPLVSLADLETRYPAELITLAADENSGIRDDSRIEAAIGAAGAEIRAILKARYSADELSRLDADSRESLSVYATDIALYRVAVSFSRTTEILQKRYDNAIKRLESIAAGKGGLTFTVAPGSTGPTLDATASPNEVLIEAPERMFTRDRTRGL